VRETRFDLLPDVVVFEPDLHGDDRGFLFESYRECDFEQAVGGHRRFVQDNHSRSRRGVLRGLHYQHRQPQGKLIRVVEGVVFDVAVDLRRGSPAFGRWVGCRLSAENRKQMWVPEGFAHGFLVLSDVAECVYKATDYYAPADECCLIWNDPTVDVAWPLGGALFPTVSAKDSQGSPLDRCATFP
jgi:dTDP-4-dehydrorhamnose 3,5-epimerase